MQLALVLGHATSTVKHPAMAGWRLLVAQPLGVDDRDDGEPQLVIDELGAGRGDKVILSSDGKAVSTMMGHQDTPVRWAVQGIVDE
jgi:ethanolamine utilization protein EutN